MKNLTTANEITLSIILLGSLLLVIHSLRPDLQKWQRRLGVLTGLLGLPYVAMDLCSWCLYIGMWSILGQLLPSILRGTVWAGFLLQCCSRSFFRRKSCSASPQYRPLLLPFLRSCITSRDIWVGDSFFVVRHRLVHWSVGFLSLAMDQRRQTGGSKWRCPVSISRIATSVITAAYRIQVAQLIS